MSSSFVHLHTHSEYSMLDGASKIVDLVKAAVEDGQPALGVTDHGNMYGVLDFYKECRKQGVNPIIGIEAYMSGNSRFDRPTRRGRVDDTGGDSDAGDKLYYHLTLLAENEIGYKNLIKLSSSSYLEGYYYKPRVDWELLERHHEGVIASTGCLGGLVLQALLKGDYEQAVKQAGRLQDIFGTESLFVELQDHGLAEQKRTNPDLVRLAKQIGAPLLATNDSHYTHRTDAETHDALLCVQTGATLADQKRFRFEGEEHYLKSAAEMRHLFSDYPEACDSSLLIAERAKVEIEFGHPKLPEFEVPIDFQEATYGESADRYLRHLATEGMKRRYKGAPSEEAYRRLDYELRVISEMGFSAYFLVVWDLIQYARRQKIRVGPGRGSAAGCLVAYALQIVDLDPIEYGLIFERFLNPGRKQMPDIDMDFDERYRSDMIKYASERYGWDHVAQIVTFSTIKARAAVRDAGRVLGLPYSVGDRVAKAMPPLVMGRDTPLYACLEETEGFEDGYKAASELRDMIQTDPDVARVVKVATGLSGLRRQDGIHAAAVVITHDPLTEYLPIQRKPDPNGDPADAPIVTQYEMHGVEDLGLLKMDFLGLRTLSVIERALDLIEETTGVRTDIDNVDLTDAKTYEMLQNADSIGVFQLEGGPMRSLMRSLAPTEFGDIAALVALYRPGPMAANMHTDFADRKNGRQEITYLNDDLAEVLSDTYGLMIYQESVMRVAQKFAGYTLEEADNLRKACGKKIRELIAKEREKFVQGCVTTGYCEELGTALFDIIEPFADYAFNKSHSYGYGLVAYQTAWLKANYPVQYLAAILTSVKDDKEKTAVYLGDARAHGIEVLVPDVNQSGADFTVVDQPDGSRAISFGLSAVRNVGVSIVEMIVEERKTGGRFNSFIDFCLRVDPMVLNRRVVESLIKGGAFDSMDHPRRGLWEIQEPAVAKVLQKRKDFSQGIFGLFDAPSDSMELDETDLRIEIPEGEWPRSELLAYEKEMLGLYVSSHPLSDLTDALRKVVSTSILDLKESSSETNYSSEVTVGGVVTSLSKRTTRRGELMASFILEDLDSSVEVFLFPKSMSENGHLLSEDTVVLVKARVDQREDQFKLVCNSIEVLDLKPENRSPVEFQLAQNSASMVNLENLRSLLSQYPGERPVRLKVDDRMFELPDSLRIDPSSSLRSSVRELIGAQVSL